MLRYCVGALAGRAWVTSPPKRFNTKSASGDSKCPNCSGNCKQLPLEFWTSSRACFNRLKGENRTAQGFSPGNDGQNEIALKGRPTRIGSQCIDMSLLHLIVQVYFAPNCTRSFPYETPSSRFRLTSSLEKTPVSRPPFQGDSLSVRLPRAEALGYCVFALRAIPVQPAVILDEPAMTVSGGEQPG
jgi:hypothetical protein